MIAREEEVVRGLIRRVAVLLGLVLGSCQGDMGRAALARPHVHAGARHASGKMTVVPLGQNASAAVFDPTPTRDAPAGRLFVAVQGPFDDVNNPRGVGQARVLDARDGRVLRTVSTGYAPDSVALDLPARRLFVANRIDHTVAVLDSRTGTVLRTTAVPPTPLQLVADPSTRRVVLTTGGVSDSTGMPLGNGGVSVLDAWDGRVLSMVTVPGIPRGLSVDHKRGRAYVLADTVGVVNLTGGRLAGPIPIEGSGASVAQDEETDRVFVLTSRQDNSATPAVFYLSTFNANSGRPLGTATLRGGAASLTVDTVARRVLVFASDYSAEGVRVGVCDAHTGKLLRVVRANGMMNLSGPAAPVVDTSHGRAFVGLANSTSAEVGIWNTRTGTLTHAVAVAGSYVQAMALDERRGRLYVISIAPGPNPQSYLTIIAPMP